MKLSVRWTIIIGFIVSVWATYVITTPASYFMTKNVLTSHMQDIMTNISDLTLEQAHNHLNKANSAASLAKQLLSSNVVSHELEGSSSLERYFFDQLSIYPHLAGIYIGGLDGNFFMVSRHKKYQPDGFRTKVIRHDFGQRTVDLTWRSTSFHQVASEQDPSDVYDPRARPWFKKVFKHNRVIWTDPYIFFTVQKPGITIAGPAFNEQGELKGIVGVDIEIDELSTFISKLRVGKTGRAFILHRNGDVIAYHDLDRLIVKKDEDQGLRLPKVHELGDEVVIKSFNSVNWQHDEDNLIMLAESRFGGFAYQDKQYLSMFTPFPEPELPWIIGVFIPEDDYLSDIKSSQLFNIFATFLVMFLVSVLGLVLAGKIIQPIVQLSEGAKAIERHEIDEPFELKSTFHEIQQTADSFSRMKDSLSEYKEKLLEKEKIYRAITDTANDAIILIDENERVTYQNPTAWELFGYGNDEIVGTKFNQLFRQKEDEKMLGKGVTQLANEDTVLEYGHTLELIAKTKNGQSIPVELSLAKFMLNEALHRVAIIRNITERKKAIQLREQLVNDLHDGIGGTLSNIKLLAEMTKAHNEFLPITVDNLQAIADNSEECLSEIQNYINVLDNPKLDWNGMVSEIHRFVSRNLELHNIRFETEVDIREGAPLPTTLLYMNLFRIIKEAFNNVVKHSNGDRVYFQVTVTSEKARFLFKDNGTEKNSPSDSGRGLLSMRTRVRELGGAIDFSLQDGFCITIEIPLERKSV